MKNEEKIIELLAEYLKKTDQALERIDKAYESIKKHSEQFDKHSEQFDKHSEQFDKHSEQFAQHTKQFEKHWDEITALRKESLKMQVKSDVLLQEILSISRRVQNLEDK
jgi:DNA repair exonuclease SbcCD ATPase subunit